MGKKDSDFGVLLQKLKTTFLCLAAVLADAEQKQARNPAVKEWLDNLEDAVDDAENLFGEIKYDAIKLKVEAESCTRKRKVSNFLSCLPNFFNSTDAERKTKMEEILERLETFAKQMNHLGLEKGVREEKPTERIPSTSLIIESEVFGRNADKDAIMKLLMSNDLGSQKISVIPLVGMGGIGKTTLAQVLFNDKRVEQMFEHKAWVCVSDEFDVCKVTETILKAVTSNACNDTNLNSLQVMLKEKLTEKKFCIVLDDVWDENYVKWEDLMKPFKNGAQGSKIIVTTRSEKVAGIMGTIDPHYLERLTDEECWQLFAKHASSDFNRDFTLNSDLKRIGRDIAKKCKGLPLAAKALGGILRSTLDVGRWERIAKSNIWELTDNQSSILPALKLSYYYLPAHLKRCFVYCSIFPKDYEFQKEELILLWMAEELVENSEKNSRMEEVGEEYFDDLVSMSFFQQLRTNENTSYFVMHDLMVDLARSISEKYFCLLLDQSGNSTEFKMKTRHLACCMKLHDLYDKRFNYVFEATHLRTFLLQKERWFSSSCLSNVVLSLLLKLRYLRVLSFSVSSISELPNSIGELKHLRYLDLSSTSIKILPESLTILYNLQTLKLYCCIYLETLPKDMHHLINLRYLDIRNCYSLVEMPSHISKLKSLQMLSIFIVGKDSGVKIGELKQLSGLRGELCIKKLENVVNVEDASDQAHLTDKNHLKHLSLEWSYKCSVDDSIHERNVLHMLSPNRTLKELEIFGYPGTTFPNWVGDDSFSNIVYMRLSRCRHCLFLPPLGQLPSLKTLIISGFEAVVNVGVEFCGTSSTRKPFSSLEILKFRKMLSWEKWEVEDIGTFRKLKELEICYCQKLTGDFPRFLPSSANLTIRCENLVSAFPRLGGVLQLDFRGCENPMSQLNSLFEALKQIEACPQGMSISGCSSLIFKCEKFESSLYHRLELLEELTLYGCDDSFRFVPIDFFPKLKSLVIYDCKSLESLSMSNGQCLTSLSSLCISCCPNFVFFPQSGLLAPNLTFLQTERCEKLKSLPKNMHDLLISLETLVIRHCPEIESFPLYGLPFSLSTLEISYCNKLVASGANWNLPKLRNLSSFTISGSNEEVESFPEEGLLPTTITFLHISSFPKLRVLDKNGLQQLTSLKELVIWSCPELRTMPEEGFSASLEELRVLVCPELQTIPKEGFPTSFKELSFARCPLLEKICHPENVEYWSKICRIPFIEINGKIIK